jgi:hypothetical protein
VEIPPDLKSVASSQRIKDAVLEVTGASAPERKVSSPKQTSVAEASTEGGRGTLRPAIVAILQKSKKPLRTTEIYDSLVEQGYQFTFKDAKKVLGIRLYKMLGVQPLGGGLFKAK